MEILSLASPGFASSVYILLVHKGGENVVAHFVYAERASISVGRGALRNGRSVEDRQNGFRDLSASGRNASFICMMWHYFAILSNKLGRSAGTLWHVGDVDF